MTPDLFSRRPVTSAELSMIDQVVREVARAWRLSADDTLDFGQSVHLRFLERNYDALVQFSARASLRTFLHVVIRRMLIDWMRSHSGKWRPSAEAVRLGADAVLLERLLVRDEHTESEAVAIAASRPNAQPTRVLAELVGQLPARVRVRMVSDTAIEHVGCSTNGVDLVEERERQQREQRRRAALRTALRQLSPDERRLISLRFGAGQTMTAVSKVLKTDAKALFRRKDAVMRKLRVSIEAQGISKRDLH